MPSDQTLWLARDVHVATVDTDLVFLSVDRDAYFCLPDAAGILTAGETGQVRVTDADWARELLQAGLLARGPASAGPAKSKAPLPRPYESALPLAAPLPGWCDVAPGLRAVADITATYRGQSLARLLARARRPREATPTVSAELLDQVEDFHRWIPYAPVSGKCLLRSYMLLRHLRRSGLDAIWVFGVRTWPFHAHCWLQCETLVLDDHVERVAAFTPILTV